ncbi:hypothetical protein PMAC_001855 [Pneumocystis sp. 'macacae']|nr:hypothetical protein PMAC_001855 [Pneumocystis sp. 'macacae']
MVRTPTLIARLFEKFPCILYPPLQVDPPLDPTCNHLFVAYKPHTSPGAPSHDPESLRWQTFLLLAGIPHTVHSASPHGSPSGTLPFLVAACNRHQAPDTEHCAYTPADGPPSVGSLPPAADTAYPAVYAFPSAAGRLWLAQQGAELNPFAGNTALAADVDCYLSLIENVLYDAWVGLLHCVHSMHSVYITRSMAQRVWPRLRCMH